MSSFVFVSFYFLGLSGSGLRVLSTPLLIVFRHCLISALRYEYAHFFSVSTGFTCLLSSIPEFYLFFLFLYHISQCLLVIGFVLCEGLPFTLLTQLTLLYATVAMLFHDMVKSVYLGSKLSKDRGLKS